MLIAIINETPVNITSITSYFRLYRKARIKADTKYSPTITIFTDRHSKSEFLQCASCVNITIAEFNGANSQKYLSNTNKEHKHNNVNQLYVTSMYIQPAEFKYAQTP